MEQGKVTVGPDSVGAGEWTQSGNNLPCQHNHYCPCAQHVQSRIEAWFETVELRDNSPT